VYDERLGCSIIEDSRHNLTLYMFGRMDDALFRMLVIKTLWQWLLSIGELN
jgi:hypothetical protein